MFESVGWGEILVLALIGLFVLGPERLPGAVRWVADTMKTVRDYASGAREQLRNEMGSEFEDFRQPLEDLRSIRGMDPRQAVRRALLDPVSDGTWTGAGTPAASDPATAGGAVAGGAAALASSNGAGSQNGHGAQNGTGGQNGTGVPAGANGVVKGQSDRALPLGPDERAPLDPDAT